MIVRSVPLLFVVRYLAGVAAFVTFGNNFIHQRLTLLPMVWQEESNYGNWTSNAANWIPQLPAMGAGSSCSANPSTRQSTAVEPFNSTSAASPSAFVSSKFELQYTCNVCETRNRVVINRVAYREGMVVAICKGCDSKHWIADNLDPSLASNNIEELLASKDTEEKVSRVTPEVYEIERVWDFIGGQMTDEKGKPVLE